MYSKEGFAAGPARVPWAVRGDAYTVSSMKIVSGKAKMKSVYNFTNRRSPMDAFPGIANDGRMVLAGLTDFIQRELTKPETRLDIEFVDSFMSNRHSFGGTLDFDKEMWLRVVNEYGGRLPIKIEALPEGSTFWINEPVIQITSLGKGFGEVAAIVEAALVGYVANATARLTLTRHLLERMRDLVCKYNPTYSPKQVEDLASWMIHDFGMRASSTTAESEIYGRQHLLVFNGTDTFNAAYQAWVNGAEPPIGTSILALAHRIVMGFNTEEEAYEAIYNATSGPSDSIGSYVADCYDFHHAVSNFLVNLASRKRATVVARPDSGDYLENVVFIVEEALRAGLYKLDEQGKPVATHLRFLQGDSMNYDKIAKIMQALDDKGVNPTRWGIFGVGGWLRNTPNRDTLSSAYKLSAYGESSTPCVKLSDTLAKVSVPGPNVVVRHSGIGRQPSVFMRSNIDLEPHLWASYDWLPAYRTFYDGSKKGMEVFGDACLDSFPKIRDRVINEFDRSGFVPHDFGSRSCPTLSPAIREFQRASMRRHGKTESRYAY